MMALAALGVSALLTGCQTAEKAAYTVTSASYTTVDSAMQAWGAYVSQYHPGVAMEQKVKAVYEQYQASARAVADAGLAYRKAVEAGGASAGVKASLDQALAVASASLSNLVQVLATFGINLKIA